MNFDTTSNDRRNDRVAAGDIDDVLHVEVSRQPEHATIDFTCPVCGAQQPLSADCRRCQADLTLVVGLRAELATKRARCLAFVRQRRLMNATRLAKECLELSSDESTHRLLALCYLLQGDFASALRSRASVD